MGPFPHDDIPAEISKANPAGTDGFEFIEYAHPEPEKLGALFEQMGFRKVAQHRSKNVSLYRQGDINYIINAEPNSFAQKFAAKHGPCVCAMGWRVVDAAHALNHAVEKGAKVVETIANPMELNIPAIEGIGGSLIYFVDRYGDKGSIYDVDFEWLEPVSQKWAPVLGTKTRGNKDQKNPHDEPFGLHYIDHLTHNVMRGNMDKWSEFYERVFNFKEIRFFDIEGKLTGLLSRAMTSPCCKIRIPINESTDDKSQIEEFLADYNGEGIQHIATGCRDIFQSVEFMRKSGLEFMPAPPDTYYEGIDARLAGHCENIDDLRSSGILIDGEGVVDGGETKVLLQIFSQTVIGPIFFEFIQRKGDDGFGEGNFRALFESIEEDQIRRGVI